ncbi:holin [Paenibacillus wynnii]|uniref:Holin n=1 Tax=Paenibacillus wynnii TaxID=268407 RepID=A0A098MES7_9BACL|nr:holin [Paenibacillus wynnii]KGE21065.1 holin [Paenibacillus wynnii]
MNNEVLNYVLSFASGLSVFVLALVQLVKKSISIPRNIVPIVGLLLGLLVGVVSGPISNLDLGLRLWAGAIAGLSATGLFELAFKDRPGFTGKRK